ncbi:unnamed protein product [Clavelina lepadiformis]|uniref:C2H2-type domain-containing protein n=1 Tax=Clavelina lepadiformis TaxID=159417 RepID=A0ABP0GLL7_CLALP
METDLIQNQVDGNGATMTIRHLFMQEIKSVRMNVEKELVKLEEKIEELILKHFLEETDRAEVVSSTLSYEQASVSPSIQSDVCDQEAYSENSSIFAHFEKIKENFLLDEEQEGLQRLYFKKSETFPKHVAENLSENFKNNFYTSLSRSGVSDVSSNASGIDDYSVNDGFFSDQESKSFENATNKEPCASSALENFQGPIDQKGLTRICCRKTVTKAIGNLLLRELKSIRKDMKKEFIKMEEKIEELNLKQLKAEANKRMPLTEEENTKTTDEPSQDLLCLSHGNELPVMPDPQHTESDPSISAKQCSSRSGSFSSRVVIVEEEPSLVLEQQPSEPSQKSDRKTKQNFFENATTKSVPKNHKLAIDAVTTRSVTKKQKLSIESCQVKSKSNQDKKESAKKHLRISFGKADLVAEMQCKFLEESETPLKYDETLNDEKFICDVCDKSFLKRRYLCIHKQLHSTIKPYTCKYCEKSFPHKYRLNKHLLMHTGDKPWSCVTCGQRFREKYKLKRHLRIHTKEKPIQCPICPRRLSSGTCLKTHMRCHNGEKPWICEICEKRFRSKFSLARHQVTHTSNFRFCM